MKRNLIKEIEIPEGVNVKIEGSTLIVKGKEGELKKRFILGKLKLKHEENKVIIGQKESTKKEKRLMNTYVAHIKNMIKGVQEKFEYKLRIVFHHFPITVEVKGNEALIKNFLGEKMPRKLSLPEGIEIESTKDTIIIKSIDKELAGQAAANFERSTKVGKRDRRIFQDGIFIVNKAGVEI